MFKEAKVSCVSSSYNSEFLCMISGFKVQFRFFKVPFRFFKVQFRFFNLCKKVRGNLKVATSKFSFLIVIFLANSTLDFQTNKRLYTEINSNRPIIFTSTSFVLKSLWNDRGRLASSKEKDDCILQINLKCARCLSSFALQNEWQQ